MLMLDQEDRDRYEAVRAAARARNESSGPYACQSPALPRTGESLGRIAYGAKVSDQTEVELAAEQFADRVFDHFDVWSVVSVEEAAEAGGVLVATAVKYIEILRESRRWTYRTNRWRTVLQQKGSIGPFRLTPKDPDCRFAVPSYSERKATAKAAKSLARILAVHEPGSEVSTRDVMAVLGIGATAVYRLVARLKGSGDWPFEAAENRRAVAVDSVAQSCIGK